MRVQVMCYLLSCSEYDTVSLLSYHKYIMDRMQY